LLKAVLFSSGIRRAQVDAFKYFSFLPSFLSLYSLYPSVFGTIETFDFSCTSPSLKILAHWFLRLMPGQFQIFPAGCLQIVFFALLNKFFIFQPLFSLELVVFWSISGVFLVAPPFFLSKSGLFLI